MFAHELGWSLGLTVLLLLLVLAGCALAMAGDAAGEVASALSGSIAASALNGLLEPEISSGRGGGEIGSPT